MSERSSKLWELLWSPVVPTALAIYLAWQGLLPMAERSAGYSVLAALVLVGHSVGVYFFDCRYTARRGNQIRRLTTEALGLINDLGSISTRQYDLWKVEIYLAKRQFRLVRAELPGFHTAPVRVASVSISPMSPVRDDHSLISKGPIGIAYDDVRTVLWCAPDEEVTLGGSSVGRGLNTEIRTHLSERFGAVLVVPITSPQADRCIGAVAVSVEPGMEDRVRSTIGGDACRRLLLATARTVFDGVEA